MISATSSAGSKSAASLLSPAANPNTLPGSNPLDNSLKAASQGKLLKAANDEQDPQLREAFDSFVGETFYGQLLASMRKMTHKSAYFNGGRAEEVFRGQLDQALSTEMTKANAHSFTGPMFDLFMLNRK